MNSIIAIFSIILSMTSFGASIERSYALPANPSHAMRFNKYFSDDEIIEVNFQLNPENENNISGEGLFVFEQRHSTADTEACVKMFLSDCHQKKITNIQPSEVYSEEGFTVEEVGIWLKRNDVIVEQHEVPQGSRGFDKLKYLVEKKGSLIYFALNEHSHIAHTIIVDDISGKYDRVRLRDPYHGWEITVTRGAFEQRISGLSALSFKSMKKSNKFKSTLKKMFKREKKHTDLSSDYRIY